MAKRTLENSKAGWVQVASDPERWVLHWLDENGKPAEPIGVDREMDVPGAHTPGRAIARLALPPEVQHAGKWA